MNNATKNEIIAATKAYMEDKGMSPADMNKLSGVSQTYLSYMLNGKYEVPGQNGGPAVVIADKWYILLADAVGMNVEKVYWKTIVTKQMRQIITAMTTAKENGRMATIICETGLGKTYCVDRFYKENPKHTYIITISSLTRLHDVINELTTALGLAVKGSKSMRMMNIVMKLREIKRSGGKPAIMFDEWENAEHSLVKMMKGFYDGVIGFASIIKIGTSQALTNMEKAKNQNIQGGPQYYRRFKASIIKVSSVPNFEPFFDAFVSDKELRKLLGQMCDNYGELHDYLEPALREADVRDVPLTADMFRVMYGLAA